MKNVFLVLIIFIGSWSSVYTTERPELYGFAPAYLNDDENLDKIIIEKNVVSYIVTDLLLSIDEKGNVTDVSAVDTVYQFMADDFLNHKDFIRFSPALFNNVAVKSNLIIQVSLSKYRKIPRILFPSDSLNIIDSEFFLTSVEASGIKFPQILKFPSYFCNLKFTDSSKIYPLIILKVELDETGALINVNEDFSSYPEFTDQLISAVMYAEFAPARINNQAVSSTAYLVISFFNLVNYPTKIWDKQLLDSMSILNKNRIQLFPDKIGLINKPLPRAVPGDIINAKAFPVNIYQPIEVRLIVDFTAKVIPSVTGNVSKFIKTRVISYLSKRKFYPAIDFTGNPVRHKGKIELHPNNESTIRILYDL